MMKRVTDRGFKAGEQQSGTIRTRVTSCQRDSGAILRHHAQCVIASEQPDPAEGEILFDDLEGISALSNYMSHPFDQVSAHILTFYLSANCGLATPSLDRSRKETAQKKWPVFCYLLIKHQCVPHCTRRCVEILARRNRGGILPRARGINLHRVSYFPRFLRLQRAWHTFVTR
jgi:hypothetical protein